MRNLFTSLIDEEIRRDEAYRTALLTKSRSDGLNRGNTSLPILVPRPEAFVGDTETTPRPPNGDPPPPTTPGFSIGVATPGLGPHYFAASPSHLQSNSEGDGSSERGDDSNNSQVSNAGAGASEYFSPMATSQPSEASSESDQKLPMTPDERGADTVPSSPVDEKDEKKKSSLFGKKFQMNFQNMKLGRVSSESKPVAAAQATKKVDEAESDKSSEKEEKTFDNGFLGIVQRMRHDYEEQLQLHPDEPLTVGVTPCPVDEAPDLRPPAQTLVLVQEDDPESGGVADLYRGTAGDLGRDIDIIERVAPSWLGELLLRVRRYKDAKILLARTTLTLLLSRTMYLPRRQSKSHSRCNLSATNFPALPQLTGPSLCPFIHSDSPSLLPPFLLSIEEEH
jgi:WD repeat-containing protein 48